MILAVLRAWGWRQVAVGLSAAVVTALIVGVPTGIVRTPFYTRMTPVLWWNYPVWALTAILSGLLVATYVRAGDTEPRRSGRLLGGGVLSVLAVGCPICNKIVVLALGVSGAMTYFAPLQPVLAVVSLGLLGYALAQRLRYAAACPLPG